MFTYIFKSALMWGSGGKRVKGHISEIREFKGGFWLHARPSVLFPMCAVTKMYCRRDDVNGKNKVMVWCVNDKDVLQIWHVKDKNILLIWAHQGQRCIGDVTISMTVMYWMCDFLNDSNVLLSVTMSVMYYLLWQCQRCIAECDNVDDKDALLTGTTSMTKMHCWCDNVHYNQHFYFYIISFL